MDILTLIKSLLRLGSDTSNDEVLESLTTVTKQQIFTICNRTEKDMDDKLKALIAEIVVIRFWRLGNEGKPSDSISVISETFFSGTSDLPESITKRFSSVRRMRVVK